MSDLAWTVRDGWALTARELVKVRHEPGQLIGTVLFPGFMVLMFGYIFGSAIDVPGGGNYREFLMPGLFAMTAVVGVMPSALLMSKDAAAGVVDRFRAMPISRGVVPFGRTLADLLTGTIGTLVMVVVGLAVGWRARHGLADAAAAVGLIIALRYALSWAGVALGLSVTPETADSFVPLVFPATMLSNGFVPTAGMPAALRTIADWNPVSALVVATRQLFGNPGAAVGPDAAWPLQHPTAAVLAWTAALLLVFVPLAAWRYQRAGQ
jgi:ABC-2 type transport system permease protein